jgi:hypothetical protein
MGKKLAILFLPALMAVFVGAPAFAQMKEGGDHRADDTQHSRTAIATKPGMGPTSGFVIIPGNHPLFKEHP